MDTNLQWLFRSWGRVALALNFQTWTKKPTAHFWASPEHSWHFCSILNHVWEPKKPGTTIKSSSSSGEVSVIILLFSKRLPAQMMPNPSTQRHSPVYAGEQPWPTWSWWHCKLLTSRRGFLPHFRKGWFIGNVDRGKNIPKVALRDLVLSFALQRHDCVFHSWVPVAWANLPKLTHLDWLLDSLLQPVYATITHNWDSEAQLFPMVTS